MGTRSDPVRDGHAERPGAGSVTDRTPGGSSSGDIAVCGQERRTVPDEPDFVPGDEPEGRRRAIQGSNTIAGYTVIEEAAASAVDEEPPLTADEAT